MTDERKYTYIVFSFMVWDHGSYRIFYPLKHISLIAGSGKIILLTKYWIFRGSAVYTIHDI